MKQTITIYTESKNGIVTNISKSTIEQPKIKFKGGSIKWFDDTKLIKKYAPKE